MDIATKEIQKLSDDCRIKLKATAPVYAWNYFNNYPIDSDELIYEKELDLKDFNLKNDNENIIIELSGKSKVDSLNQILNILFNEKSNDYDEELGYSGFQFEKAIFDFKDENNDDIKLVIDNFNAKISKNN